MPKKLPDFVDLDALGPLRDREGVELDPEDKRLFLDGLSRESPKAHDPSLLGEWRARLDPDDAERWADGLEAAWHGAGTPAKHKWAMFALTYFGSERRISEVAPTLQAMASSGGSARAKWYVIMLARRANPDALAWLFDVAFNAKAQTVLQRYAAESLEDIAKQRDFERLEDFLPELNRFIRHIHDERAFFDEIAGAAALTDEQTKTLTGWLEHAMLTGRTFPLEHLRQTFLATPALHRFLEGVVWQTEDGALLHFSEGDAFDAQEDDLALGQDASLRVAVPVMMGERAVAQWAECFADSEIWQPIDQLDRASFPLDYDILADLAHVRGRSVFRFSRRLWEHKWLRGPVEGGGQYNSHVHTLPGYGVRVWLDHPEIEVASDFLVSEDFYIRSVSFDSLTSRAIDRADLDPVAFSEACRLIQQTFPPGESFDQD